MRLSRFVRSSRSDGAATWEVTKLQTQISTAQLELFNESALPEAVTLHADRPGFFSLLVKPVATTPRQTSYRVDLLPQVLAALDPDIDSYMSQATFFRPNRRLVNLWHLPLCFVDLDTYKTAYGKLHEEPLSLAVRQHLTDEGIPPASLVVHSGRGVYLKWLLKSPLPQAALPRWNAVQRELVSRLADLGADPKARDASRVLRLVSTCNTKQPDPEFRKVRVLWVEEADGAPLAGPRRDLSAAHLGVRCELNWKIPARSFLTPAQTPVRHRRPVPTSARWWEARSASDTVMFLPCEAIEANRTRVQPSVFSAF